MSTAHRTPTSLTQRLHRFLLPEAANLGVMPYVTLVYLSIFFFSYFFDPPTPREVWIGLASVAIFLVLYFRGYWVAASRVPGYIGALWLLGMAMATVNVGSSVYVVYAAAFCIRLEPPRRAWLILSLLVITTLTAGWLMQFSLHFLLPATFFGALIGGMNIYMHEMSQKDSALSLSQQEVRRLATAAERERIARDLHDLIGHTFSMITLKSELAQRLIDLDPARARKELNDLEHLSRDALSQVREAVSGYRRSSLATELANARLALESRHIVLDYQLPDSPLPEAVDAEFAKILREAVTNIIRHSSATECIVRVQQDREGVRLEIRDNGQAGILTEGNGLKGIRERVRSLRGQLNIEQVEGVRLQVQVQPT